MHRVCLPHEENAHLHMLMRHRTLDIVSSDFYLFPKLKKHLGGKTFVDDDNVQSAGGKFL